MCLKSQFQPKWKIADKIAIMAAALSLVALVSSWRTNNNIYELQTMQNGMNIINGFSNKDVVDASYAVIRTSQKLPLTEDELIRFRQAASPLGQQLKTLAACLDLHACSGETAINIFCSHSQLYDKVLAEAHRAAGVPLEAGDKFYLSQKSRCQT